MRLPFLLTGQFAARPAALLNDRETRLRSLHRATGSAPDSGKPRPSQGRTGASLRLADHEPFMLSVNYAIAVVSAKVAVVPVWLATIVPVNEPPTIPSREVLNWASVFTTPLTLYTTVPVRSVPALVT